MDSYFAVCAPGLEPFTARELSGLFPNPGPATLTDANPILQSANHLQFQPSPGGVSFKGDLASLYRANLYMRTASRILARLGNFFHATTIPELRQRAARLPWERFLTPGQPVALRATCHKSKLYQSDAVTRTVLKALAERLGQTSPIQNVDEETADPPQLIIVRLVNDQCTISVDSSGTLLHKRGYRQAVAKAPLRETLAAAILMASGWDRHSPLIDPFCGSGTIPIEAVCMALGIPPGINRKFGFMDWPDFNENLWQSIHNGFQFSPDATLPLILASDRDAGAIQMAQANAGRAGVADFIEFKCRAVSSIAPPPKPGWVVTNPPYGRRISAGKDLRDLYAQFGNVLREKCSGWNVSVLCSDPVLSGQMQMKMEPSLATVNGGVKVRLESCIVR